MVDRGTTRSGARFSELNSGYYLSLEECKAHHKRLFAPDPVVHTRLVPIYGQQRRGSLAQTIVRFQFGSSQILSTLYDVFSDLFQQHSENTTDGFEVLVTFNIILFSEQEKTYHVFYGLHSAHNDMWVTDRLTPYDTVVVRTLLDVPKIKTVFDVEDVLRANRDAFRDTHVVIHSFVNVVYLIHRFVSAELRPKEKKEKKKEVNTTQEPTASTSSSVLADPLPLPKRQIFRKHYNVGDLESLPKGGKKPFKR